MDFMTRKCPSCGKTLTLTPEAGKIGVVCPNCRVFVGEKNGKMSDDELKKITAAIQEMLHNK